MITLQKYQEYCQIPSGTTDIQYKKEMVELLGLNPKTLTDKQINEELKRFAEQIVISTKKHKHIRMGNKWFKVDRELHKLKFEQWIYFDSIMGGIDKEKVWKDLDKLLAVFLRPCKVWKFFPQRFSQKSYEMSLERVKNLDIRICLELVNFFFQYTISSIQNMNIEFLEGLEQKTWKMKE